MVLLRRVVKRISTTETFTQEIKTELINSKFGGKDSSELDGLSLFDIADVISNNSNIPEEILDEVGEYILAKLIEFKVYKDAQSAQHNNQNQGTAEPPNINIQVTQDTKPSDMDPDEILNYLAEHPKSLNYKTALFNCDLVQTAKRRVGTKFGLIKTDENDASKKILDAAEVYNLLIHISQGRPVKDRWKGNFIVEFDVALGEIEDVTYLPWCGSKLYNGFDFETEIDWSGVNTHYLEAIGHAIGHNVSGLPKTFDEYTIFDELTRDELPLRWKRIVEAYDHHLEYNGLKYNLKEKPKSYQIGYYLYSNNVMRHPFNEAENKPRSLRGSGERLADSISSDEDNRSISVERPLPALKRVSNGDGSFMQGTKGTLIGVYDNLRIETSNRDIGITFVLYDLTITGTGNSGKIYCLDQTKVDAVKGNPDIEIQVLSPNQMHIIAHEFNLIR